MRILLTGARGQVGWELCRTLAPLGEVHALDSSALDLRDPEAIARVTDRIAPGLIVNAAAFTAVDRAETESDEAFAVNAEGPGHLARQAERFGAGLIHFSTDYVFDGPRLSPWREQDPTNPRNVYGRSKLAGEQAIEATGVRHLILRTAWVYGLRGHNFYRTMSRLLRERNDLGVVNDQHGSPTWCRALAEATAIMAARWMEDGKPRADRDGIYHVTAGGSATWYEFASAIADRLRAAGGPVATLRPIGSRDYPLPAPRPTYSVLDCNRVRDRFGIALPGWRHSLAQCCETDPACAPS